MSSESDNEGPEDVSFSRGKSAALEIVKSVQEHVSKGREKQREKRRQRDQQYTQQKKMKLQQLAQTKLSDKFLENISSEPVLKPATPAKNSEDRSASLGPTNKDDVHLDGDESPEDNEGGWGEQDGFIPLERYGGIQVVSIHEEAKKKKTSAQTAAEFRQKMLYQNSINRETVQSRRSTILKRKARKIKR